ncbi:MAG TPA: aminoglycoside 3'-phosphotransferase [Pseudonocardia sp.]|uniref:aminoglycoside 3'-phosphotransferase n=1 Tax=Pseudonocardia sp. TaxID=60912 RepID=UPI002B4AC504|nr:aminoglycoside 3'-phosphotransferase [Pseudonocardia sp.]HLU54172.1 aminoglycoside 3'-phosphotransferase [Pseudonocardia sp.]
MTPRAISGPPVEPVPVPAAVARLAGGDEIVPVWRNELGGVTFRLDGADGRVRYAKWIAAGRPGIDLEGEAARLAWAHGRVPVPRVLEQGRDADGSWLVTEAVPGRSAVDPRWVAEPATAAAAIGRGLRLLHDALPVDECPFDWGVEHRLARKGCCDPDLLAPPPIDRLVVCHGDACAPNTLLHDDGTFAAHVDLGSLGVADRWADLAVAAWSTEWNFGPGHEDAVHAGYGIAPDPVRIAYYRRLWDAT